MRNTFANELYKHMEKNVDIFLLTGDLGYHVFDDIKKDFPDRFLNVGAAEQAMMDIAIGLSLEGKIPFVYSITPFLIYRPFESLRTYIDHEKLNVKLVGSGRDADYAHDGFSHNASDVWAILSQLPSIIQYYPIDKAQIPDLVSAMLEKKGPEFLSLKR